MKHLLFSLLWAAGLSQASGAVIFSGPQNLSIPYTFAGIYVNPLTSATSLSQPADFDIAPWLNLDFGGVDISNGEILRPVLNVGGDVVNVSASSVIDLNDTFATGAHASSTHLGTGPGQFVPGTAGYVAFAFSPTVGGATHYGWAEVILRDSGAPGTIVQWAYEGIAGTPITVGAVPEPGSLGLLALGLCVLGRRSRRD